MLDIALTEKIVTALVSIAILIAVYVPLERLFPARQQRIFRPGFATDGLFFAGQYLVWSSVAIVALTAFHHFARSHFPNVLSRLGVPTWFLCIVAVVGGDLVVYWFHRACHAWTPLWKIHAVHHSAEHLDFLAAHREHPLDGLATQFCQNLPAIVLGVPMGWLAGIAVFRGMWGIFIHSNVRLPLGPLRYLVGAPELHHWHHASVSRTEHNFANLAPWLDVVFGTYHCPKGQETYLLGLEEPWPKGYFAQLVWPFLTFRSHATTIDSPVDLATDDTSTQRSS